MPHNDFSRHPLSWQPDAASLTRPRYLSLAAQLAENIESGALPPGTCLPSQRELADWLDINFTTITRAYDICRSRGLLYGVTGRGTFVAPLPGRTENPAQKIYDLGAAQGFPSLGADVLVETAREVLSRDYVKQLFSYEAREGTARHRAAGAYWASRFGISARPEQIVVFPGAQNALVALLLGFFNIGDSIAVDSFTYGNLIHAARLARIKLVPVAGDSEGMRPEALKDTLRRKAIKGVFIMPTCANPTTATMSARRKDMLASIIGGHGLIVIEDDATLVPDGSGTFFERLPEQTFHFSGATRFLAPGIRAAFAIAPPPHANRLVDTHHRLTIKASALDAEILSELILSGRAQSLLERKLQKALEMNSVFKKVFPREKRTTNDIPTFRTLTLPASRLNGPEIESALLKSGVRACHSYRFAVQKNPSESFLRLSLCSVDSPDDLLEALKRIKKSLHNV